MDLMARRFAMIGQVYESGDLPPGYRLAKYIETERSAARLLIPLSYFETQTGDILTVSCMWFGNNSGGGTVCGCSNTTPFDGRFQVYIPSSKLIYWGNVTGIDPVGGTSISTDTIYDIQFSAKKKLSGIRIMGYSDGQSYSMTGRVYGFNVIRNNVKVLDLVPCTNPSHISGMYDLVGGGFFSSESNVPFDYQY